VVGDDRTCARKARSTRGDQCSRQLTQVRSRRLVKSEGGRVRRHARPALACAPSERNRSLCARDRRHLRE
jgi:hypothetical protein